ncbi:MAG: hypothetical protein E7340_06335 [Clostridiales bacterium]|nr:hypothetical protein [Clostridiales bacterium]
MKLKFRLFVLILLVAVMSVPGVYATWKYTVDSTVNYQDTNFNVGITEYKWVAPSTASTVVYITNVEKKSGDGSVIINGYQSTYLSTTKTLLNNAYSSITLSITVYNSSTTDDYAFNAVKYTSEQYDNNNIGYTLIGLAREDRVPKGEYLTFDVKFAFSNTSNRSNLVLNSVMFYEFIIAEELPEEGEIAVSGALTQFKAILNNVVAKDSYNQLIDQMDKYDENNRHNSSYIGNVSGASTNDVELLGNLFGGNLKMNINGEEVPVKAMIKRENLDDNTNTGDANGNEMTIYLTTDTLQKGFLESNKTAVVYATVFTSSDDGQTWTQIGGMYQGTATINAYSGGTMFNTGGSFNTDTWKTKGNADIADGRTIEQVVASLK